jgi:hypothetical protein
MTLRRFLTLALCLASAFLVTDQLLAAAGTSVVATKGRATCVSPIWPEGVGELVNDPLRTSGWNSWFTEWPKDVNQYALEIKSTDDLNRLFHKSNTTLEQETEKEGSNRGVEGDSETLKQKREDTSLAAMKEIELFIEQRMDDLGPQSVENEEQKSQELAITRIKDAGPAVPRIVDAGESFTVRLADQLVLPSDEYWIEKYAAAVAIDALRARGVTVTLPADGSRAAVHFRDRPLPEEDAEDLARIGRAYSLSVTLRGIAFADQDARKLSRLPLKRVGLFDARITQNAIDALHSALPDVAVARTGGPFLGVSLNDDGKVTRVLRHSAAEAAGLKTGDEIRGFGGHKITNSHEVLRLVSRCHPGDTAELVIVRDSQLQKLRLQIGKLVDIGAGGESSFTGEVRHVDQQRNTVWINLGAADGIKASTKLWVFRPGNVDTSPIGRIEVTRILHDHLSQARVLQSVLRDPIRPGDVVAEPVHAPESGKTDAPQGGNKSRPSEREEASPPVNHVLKGKIRDMPDPSLTFDF